MKAFNAYIMMMRLISAITFQILFIFGTTQYLFAQDLAAQDLATQNLSLENFQQESLRLMQRPQEILEISDQTLISLLNFPLESEQMNQMSDQPCLQAFEQGIQKHLQIQSIQTQTANAKNRFSIWSQAPSLRGRSNLINSDYHDPQQLNAKVGIRLPIPTDVFDRKKAWQARIASQHWQIEAQKEELQALIYDLHLSLYQSFRLLLLKALQIKYSTLKQKQIEAIFNEGFTEKRELEKIKLDLILLHDDWQAMIHTYQDRKSVV
jgi:hypothetical protein